MKCFNFNVYSNTNNENPQNLVYISKVLFVTFFEKLSKFDFHSETKT